MPIPRLRADETAILIIDVQERLMPSIIDRDRVSTNCSILIKLADVLSMPYLVTEQYPRGLGRTVDEVTSVMTDSSRRIEKTRFSAGIELVTDQLRDWNVRSVLIGGVEAHVCVLQTVLDIHAGGRQCYVCTDAVSASQREQIPGAYRRMERAGAIPTGVLAAMYELLEDARHESFGACLELAKQVMQ